ncbi:gem-associated protein 2 isoform X3 [Anser cygnoides]|uniref:gem-associated protein 2 isoform X3 n=1 Tax=Anser cygnoides TaxID=8845 RepID=UPI002009AE83|nr:gem-associated protein 2 isoform X3 [Anser cygnoides]
MTSCPSLPELSLRLQQLTVRQLISPTDLKAFQGRVNSYYYRLSTGGLSINGIEAARCPDVVVAQIDPKKLRKKQTVNISISGCQPAPEGYSPTLKWQQQQVANFSAVRQSLNKHRNHWRSQHLDSNVNMPKLEDEEGWKKFCLGERVYSEIDSRSDNENLGIDYMKVGFPPLLSIVSRMNQATVTSVLEYLIIWFGEKKFTPELGRWFYALLACLEKPLLPEAHSLIRQLARRCSEVRVLEVF